MILANVVFLPRLCRMWVVRIGVGCLLLTLALGSASVAETPLSFNRDVRPILANHCLACHGLDAESREADLRLDLREAAIAAGAIVPGESDASELIHRVFSTDDDQVMPPPEEGKPLTVAQRETLRRWIDEGAEYQPHWSLVAPQKTRVPDVEDDGWARNPIDRFVLQKLRQQSLSPAPEASPTALFRRMHLDITGLPPTPQDLAMFVDDFQERGDDALGEWIDRLMATPAWGEHRARYWLDAARYGDTHGLHFDNYREIWPYRDWVIQAFNTNQPFDQFVIEQLAGDLLDEPTLQQRIATGFQRCNITTNEGGTIKEENLAMYAADRVQTFGWVFMGLTTNCCQCHDHKFDPLTMRDYYSLAAFFRNTTQPALDGNEKRGGGPAIVIPSESDLPRYQQLPSEIEAIQAQLETRRDEALSDFEAWTETGMRVDGPSSLVFHRWLDDPAEPGCVSHGELEWTEEGWLGPAPRLNEQHSIELGDVGDFSRTQPFSAGAWVKLVDTAVHGAIMARMDTQQEFRGWDIWYAGGDVAMHLIDAYPQNALKVITQGAPLRANEWQHVLITWDGSGTEEGIAIYIDGQAVPTRVETATLAEDATINVETPFRVGRRTDTNGLGEGTVQDVRLYERALSAAEAQQVYQLAPQELQARLPLAEMSEPQRKRFYEFYLTNHDAASIELHGQRREAQAELDKIVNASPVTLVQVERLDQVPKAAILMRGAYDQPGAEVEAAPPAVLPPLPEGAPPNRLGLAQWVVARDNPLTARVTVNRFWQELFGAGLVVTAEDFGVMGTPPTHPELLDWLAIEFQESGWDIKHLFKLMLMSATYRQAAVADPEKRARDRDNEFLSRGPRFRMDAEMVRDYALRVSGLLSDEMYGPGVRPYQPENIWNIVGLPGGDTRDYQQDSGDKLYRRSIYTFWKRMAPHPSLESFNAPSREVCTVRRERTNTPLQALVTLNDPQFVEAARKAAEQVLLEADDLADASTIAATLGSRVLCRPLSDVELDLVCQTHRRLRDHYIDHEAAATELLQVGEAPASPDLAPTDLAAWTMVANQLLNLDETVTK